MVRTRPTELLLRDGEALLSLVLVLVAAGQDGEEAVALVGVAQALEARHLTHGRLQALLQLPVHGGEEDRLDGAVRPDRLMAGIGSLDCISKYVPISDRIL